MRSSRIGRTGIKADMKLKCHKKDQSILDVNVSVSVLKDTDGNMIGSIGIIRDITEQKAAEQKIRDSENKIRIILDTLQRV